MKKIILFGLSALILIIVLCFILFPKPEERQVTAVLSVQEEPAVEEAAAEEPAVVPEEPLPVPEVSEPAVMTPRMRSSFDIVRVEEDGSMVAAGKGEPGTFSSLMDGESVLTEIEINEDGEWIFIPPEPLAAGTHELWLRDSLTDKRDLSEIVVVSVPERENRQETVAVLLSSGAEDVTVLQAPAGQIEAPVDIKAVNYTGGTLAVRGHAGSPGRINVYADNVFLGNVWADGDWTLRLERRLAPGQKYLIRADQVDGRGKVTARVEVPFEMEKGMETAGRRRIRIVKGDCLWSIAKQLYGTGFAYVTIYQANKNQIRDPDLIYPNQVFVLPPASEK